MTSSPIVTVNLWFDRQVLDEPFIGLPGRAMQWVFDKRAVFGGDASHLSLVSSGASPLVALSNPELIATAHQELVDALPAIRQARLVRATVVREPRATFSLAPGQPARPPAGSDARSRAVSGGRLDRHGPPRDDRERGPRRTPGGGRCLPGFEDWRNAFPHATAVRPFDVSRTFVQST